VYGIQVDERRVSARTAQNPLTFNWHAYAAAKLEDTDIVKQLAATNRVGRAKARIELYQLTEQELRQLQEKDRDEKVHEQIRRARKSIRGAAAQLIHWIVLCAGQRLSPLMFFETTR